MVLVDDDLVLGHQFGAFEKHAVGMGSTDIYADNHRRSCLSKGRGYCLPCCCPVYLIPRPRFVTENIVRVMKKPGVPKDLADASGHGYFCKVCMLCRHSMKAIRKETATAPTAQAERIRASVGGRMAVRIHLLARR